MLYLDITGKAPKRRCKKVVEWFKAKYMPNHHLDITVAHRGLKREHAQGFCTVMDCDHRPREFLIEIETTLQCITFHVRVKKNQKDKHKVLQT